MVWEFLGDCVAVDGVGNEGAEMNDRRTLLWTVLATAAWLATSACGGDEPRSDHGGTEDASVDAADAAEACATGAACGPEGVCEVGRCLPEEELSIEAEGLPGGAPALILVDFPGGACTAACDPADPDACGTCAGCAELGASRFCAPRCTRREADNDVCRDGYQCHLGQGLCVSGCASDAECQVTANADGGLAWDPDRATHVCDPMSFRCRHPGTEGVEAGDRCTKDADCEADGLCFVDVGYEGGYCTKLDCDVEGRECAGKGVCRDRLCLRGCTVGVEPEADRLGAEGHGQGCRPGHACFWDGVGQAFAEGNGSCDVGNYNDALPSTFGGPCSRHAQCYSPFGYGGCLPEAGTSLPEGLCTIFDCGAPGLPRDICGAEAQCVGFGAEDLTICLRNCASADECRAGFGCVDWDGSELTPKVCYACAHDGECRSGERCTSEPPSGSGEPTLEPSSGTCVPL